MTWVNFMMHPVRNLYLKQTWTRFANVCVYVLGTASNVENCEDPKVFCLANTYCISFPTKYAKNVQTSIPWTKPGGAEVGIHGIKTITGLRCSGGLVSE
jgi:hypothetical protein